MAVMKSVEFRPESAGRGLEPVIWLVQPPGNSLKSFQALPGGFACLFQVTKKRFDSRS